MRKKTLSIIAAFAVLPACLTAAMLVAVIPRSELDSRHTVTLPPLKPVQEKGPLTMPTVFLAHMSVGYNILEGARAAGPEALKIVETADPAAMDGDGIYHARLEHNGEPMEKIETFRKLMAGLEPALPDAAVMKFCYADFHELTDPDQLFEAYRRMIDELEAKYPTVRFLHCTVPLTSEPLTFKKRAKEAVKAVLGKTVTADRNLKRHRYNERLRAAYPAERIFDIAMLESTSPEGYACYTKYRDKRVPTMLSRYTTDGGHLNVQGKRRLGERFLAFAAAAGEEE